MTGSLATTAQETLELLAGSDVDPATLAAADGEALREAVETLQKLANAAQARQADALAELGRRARAADEAELAAVGFLHHLSEDVLVDEVSLLLSTTKATASRIYDRATRATVSEPVMRGWRSGAIDGVKTDAIVRTHELCRDALPAPELDSLICSSVQYAGRHTAPQLREWLRRREIAVDPESAERRRQQALLERRVVVRPSDDGMSQLWALLPSPRARAIQQALDRVAREAGGEDPRTMDQRRADALAELVTGEIDPPAVSVEVVVPASVLEGTSELPAWLVGVGPITAPEARALAGGDGDVAVLFRRLLADPVTGTLTDVGEKRYRPSAALDRAVRARDVTCRFPGCRRAALSVASGTDLDHTVPWPKGPTSADNLAVLCRRHHRLKHSPGWSVVLQDDGSMTWTTPTGRRFTSEPWRYLDPTDEHPGPDPPRRE